MKKYKTKKITLRNDFHGTEAAVFVPCGDFRPARQIWDGLLEADHRGDKNAAAKIRRIERQLCGADSCQCGIVRGPQEVNG